MLFSLPFMELPRLITVTVIVPMLLGGLVSCDRAKEVYQEAQGKIKSMVGDEGEGGGDYEGGDVVTVLEVNQAEGHEVIMNEDRLVMVEFYSTTCGPCKKVAPVLDSLAQKNQDRVRIVKVDAMRNKEWAMDESVRAVPAFRLYSGGMLVDQFEGAYAEGVLQQRIDQYAGAMMDSDAVKERGAVDEDGNKVRREPTIKPMPRDWLPEGVTAG